MKLTILLILISNFAFSQNCPDIANDIERLACFDAKYPKALNKIDPDIMSGVDVPELKDENDEESGNWIIKNYKDDMTGEEDWQAILTQSNREDIKGKGLINSLILSCYNHKEPSISILWQNYLGLMGEYKDILLKIDDGEAYNESWRVTTKYSTSRYFSKKKNISFLEKLGKSNFLTARTSPYSHLPVTAKFELDGIVPVINKIKNECPGKIKYWK